MGFIRSVFAFLLAVIVGTVLVTLIATQINLAALGAAGAEISFAARLDTSLQDLGGFGLTLGPILLIGYAIAFLIAWLIIRLVPSLRTFGYVAAGFVTVIVVMQAITALFGAVFESNITPVAATRTLLGLFLMSTGGAIGGWTFAALARRS